MQQLWFHTLPSTIEVAKAQLEVQCPHGTIIVARTQTAGRGQFNRSFDDVPAQSLLYSQVLYLACVSDNFSYKVGVCVQKFLQEMYGIHVQVKYPNDIYYDGFKLAGFFIEPQYIGHQLEGVIVSVGMNIHQSPKAQKQAICLQEIYPYDYNIEKIATQLQHWFVRYLI